MKKSERDEIISNIAKDYPKGWPVRDMSPLDQQTWLSVCNLPLEPEEE